MNEVIKNTHAFVDVLCMARGDAVQNWDEATFKRAYKWGRYFEEVYNKLKQKPALAEKLDKYLSNFNKTGTFNLGNLKLTFENLKQSGEIMRGLLLQNPHINSSQFQFVLKLYRVRIGEPIVENTTAANELSKDLIKLNQLRGSLDVLCKMRDRLCKDMKEMESEGSETNYNLDREPQRTLDQRILDQTSQQRTHDQACFMGQGGVSTNDVGIMTMAQLLFQHMHHHLTYSGQNDKPLIERLNLLADQENGLKIIATCLVFIPDPTVKLHSQADQVQQFTLKWLLDFLSSSASSTKFWNLPLRILAMASFKYSSIFKLYMNHLVSWGNHMVPRVTYQSFDQVYSWRYGSDCDLPTSSERNNEETLDVSTVDRSFDALVAHFASLTHGPLNIAEHCYKAIEAQTLEFEKSRQSSVLVQKLRINVWRDVHQKLLEKSY